MDEALVKIRHERSKRDFPGLKLDEDEYVEFFFRRAKVCLGMIWGATAFGLIAVLLAFLVVIMGQSMIDDMGRNFIFIILFTLLAAVFLIFLVALKVYQGNKLYITNKHVVQMIMNSPVSTSINIIDLVSVEDASFRQENLLQKMFKYGTFRLATVGDETTYTFKYSDVSPDELREVSKLLTSVKEEAGRKAVAAAAEKKEQA